MENKKIIIGLGVLAFAGIGYYMWKKNKSENKSNASGCDCGCGCCDDKEDVSNVISEDGNCIIHYMKSGLSVDEARAKCSSGIVIKNPKYNEIKSNMAKGIGQKKSNIKNNITGVSFVGNKIRNEINSNIISQNPFDKNTQVNDCINDQTLGYGVPFEEAVLMCGGVQSTASVRPIVNNINKLVTR